MFPTRRFLDEWELGFHLYLQATGSEGQINLLIALRAASFELTPVALAP